MAGRELHESDVGPEPMVEVERWVDEARAAAVVDWDAMVVATADADGAPSARVVLLRGLDPDGFCFYTSYESEKGRNLADNPRAAIVLHFGEQGSAFLVYAQDRIHRRRVLLAVLQRCADKVGFFADQIQV